MGTQKFRKLNVWHKSMDFVEDIYKLTTNFPAKELYGLTSQLRRAATSIALNIAEGSGAGSQLEFRRYLTMALRSNYELMCGMEIARRVQYCTETNMNHVLKQSDEISAMLTGLKNKLIADS